MLDRLADAAGLTPAGRFETDTTANGYPALPVRSADCLVWLATAPSPDHLDRVAEAAVELRATLRDDDPTGGRGEIQIEIRRLLPTDRSRLGR